MKYTSLFCSILIIWIVPPKVATMQDVYYQVINQGEVNANGSCDETQVNQWKNNFHDCFTTRKFKDGGQDLESIVDRILGHAEACIETSARNCIPDFAGFKYILSTVIEQMKDYSSMYLEAIFRGREKIKDLKCVEDSLSIDVYDKCFNGLQPPSKKTYSEFKNKVKEGIQCTNNKNVECSKEARTSLNRIVRNIFSLEQPSEEEDMTVKPTPPPPKKWYNYITDPIATAWESVKKFFSNLFG